MIAEMNKIQVAVPSEKKEEFLEWLQQKSVLHLAPLSVERGSAPATQTAYLLAQVQFALEFVRRIRTELKEPVKKSWKDLFAGKPVATLAQLESTLASLKLEDLLSDVRKTSDSLADIISKREQALEERVTYMPWRSLLITGKDIRAVEDTVSHFLGVLNAAEMPRIQEALEDVPTAVWQPVRSVKNKKKETLYIEIVGHKEDNENIQAVLDDAGAQTVLLELADKETPQRRVEDADKTLTALKKEYETALKKARSVLAMERKLQFTYDALLHRVERENLFKSSAHYSFVYVMAGWIPSSAQQEFVQEIENKFGGAVEEVLPEENEQAPVLFKNSKAMEPFEAVTDIYGKPRYSELDPSPLLSVFFLVGFGLALTDAGYGIILMIATYAVQKFMKTKKGFRKMLQLLFYAGATTVVLGALTGGWFGITLEELPASKIRDGLLFVKVIDPVQEPMRLLLVAFAVGVVQLLFAWGIKAFDLWRQGQKGAALTDGIAWITMVLAILFWAGASRGILPQSLEQVSLFWIYGNALVLILTQGRAYKNLAIRLGAGVMSLYGLISFVSDVLSYSRLLALGLATGIIGLVVNLIGGMVIDMVPVVGFAVAGVILVVGHIFNLGINALGAFIHSGRLQFVEFFPKFIEGGGVPFRPFGRIGKYVDDPSEFN